METWNLRTWNPANLRGPERKWFLHPSVSRREVFWMSHQNISCWPVVCAWRVCRLSLIWIRRIAHGPTRHHLSACHLRKWGGSNTPSPSSLRRDATSRVHIILANLWQRRCSVSWTLLVVIIPLNHHPGLCSFTCTRGRPFGVGATIPLLHVHQACVDVDSTVSYPVFVWEENWMSFQHLARLFLESVCCLTACPALSSRWPGALDTCVSFGLPPQEGVKSSWWRCPAGQKLLVIPKLTTSVKISCGTSLISEQLGWSFPSPVASLSREDCMEILTDGKPHLTVLPVFFTSPFYVRMQSINQWNILHTFNMPTSYQ